MHPAQPQPDERVPRRAGVVLAGGRGVRMGGRDKGLVEWRGQALAAHVLAHLRPQVDEVLVSANRNLEAYAALEARVVTDTVPGFVGPLAGMLAALRATRAPWLLVASCDTPWFPDDLAQRLDAACRAAGTCAAYARSPEGPLYTHALLHRTCEEALEAALRSEDRSARTLLQSVGASVVEFPDWLAPLNLNSL